MDVDFKIQKAKAQIVMDHPFVASILLKHPVKARTDIPTLAVDGRGQIYYNPKFIEGLSVPQVVWGLSHEVFHRIGQHVLRKQKRDHGKWNYATDAWINDTLDQAKIGTRIENTVNMPGSAAETCENIYAKLPKDGGGKGKGKGNGPPQPGGQPGEDPMDGDGVGDDLLDENVPKTESEAKEQEAEIKIEVAEAAQVAKMRGKLPAALARFAAAIIDVKTPWYDILERYMVGLTNAEYSWKRPNKRHAHNDMYLPVTGTVPQLGEVVIQIDVSGSVSPAEGMHFGGHVKRIAEMCYPTRVHVLYTDAAVQKHDVFEFGEEVEFKFFSGGGTDMTAGYDYVAKQGIDPDVFITLTDGYTPFPEKPDFPSVWCISSKDVTAPDAAGETIHFEMEVK